MIDRHKAAPALAPVPPHRRWRARRCLRLPLAALALAGAAAATALDPVPAAAQQQDTLRPDTVYEMAPIAVRAVRPSATTGGVSAITIRMDSVRFRPAPLLEDVLRELPLVQVRTNSRGEAQLALRGAEERQIAILLDGVPLTLGWDHRTDLSVVPMTAARRIDLVRGMSSVLHGPNVLGGAVEIRVGSARSDGAVDPLQVAAGTDHNGGFSAAATTGRSIRGDAGHLVVRGGMGHRSRDGVTAPDDAASVHPALATSGLRANSDLQHTDAFVSLRYAPYSGSWVSTTISGFQAERGVPPELNESSPRLWRYPDVRRLVTIVAGGLDGIHTPPGEARLDVNLGIDLGRVRIEQYSLPAPDVLASATGPDPFYGTVDETEQARDRTLTLRLRGSQDVGAAQLALAATAADVHHDETITIGLAGSSDGTAIDGQYRQRLWSLAAETEVPFDLDIGPVTGGRMSAGTAWDGADTPEAGPDMEGGGPTMTEWGGRIGVSASTARAFLVHAGLSRRGRFPALREMYSSALGRFHPNPDLSPEVLTAVEAGFTSRIGRYDLQLVGFHQRLDGAIARGAPPAGSDARYMRVNRDQIRSTGLELMAGYSLGRLALETEATLQSVEVVEPGAEGVRAEYEPTFAGGVGGTIPLVVGIEASAEVEYWGRQFCATPSPGAEDYATLEPSTRTDLQLSRSFRLPRSMATFQQAGLELAVDNFMDSLVYDQCGLPHPGRTVRVQVRLQ